MTIVHGLVGVGPGWPAMRTKSNVNIAVRAPERVTVDGMVIEPAYADLRISSNGRFTVELEPGAWYFRIQYGNYKVIRLLEVPAGTDADYEDLVELDPGTLPPLPPLIDAADALISGIIQDEDSDTYDALAAAFIAVQQKGAASGVATLDGASKLPEAQVPPRLSTASLSSTFAAAKNAVLGSRWVFDGDSVTIGSIIPEAGQQNNGKSWTTAFAQASQGKVLNVFNAGLTGQQSSGALARFDSYVAPSAPDVVLLTIGTNDVGNSVAQATWLQNISDYYDKCKAIGAQLVLGHIWPSSLNTPAGRPATIRAWNQVLDAWASARGIPVIPWSELADPTTGGWPATWTSDSIHPGLLDSYTQIGVFGWAKIAARVGQPVAQRAIANGSDLLPNGFLTTLITPPTIVTPVLTPSTASGTLAAGTYGYKITSRTYWGETLPSTEVTTVLAGTGQVTVSWTAASQSPRGYRIYRKAPGGSTWYLVQEITSGSTTSWVDTGATAGAAITGVDSSQIVSGLTLGTVVFHNIDGTPVAAPRAGVRGNVLHLNALSNGASATVYFTTADVAPGNVLDFSCLHAAAGPSATQVRLRFYSATAGGGTQVSSYSLADNVMSSTFSLISKRVVVPAGVVSIRVSFEWAAGFTWFEAAEIRLAKVA